MASGDLTATSIGIGTLSDTTDLVNAISAANLAAATDTVHIIPIPGRDGYARAIKVEREA